MPSFGNKMPTTTAIFIPLAVLRRQEGGLQVCVLCEVYQHRQPCQFEQVMGAKVGMVA